MRKISSIILVAFITTSILPMDLWAGEGASALAVQAARGKVVAGGKPASRLDDLFAHLRNPEQALSARQAILGNLELVGLQESRLEYIIFSSVRALADEASQPHAQWILINIARQSQRHKEKVTRILGEYFAHEALTIAITDTLFEIAEVTDWEDRFSNARKRHPEYTCGMVVSVIPDKGCWVIFYDEDRSVYVAGYIERAEVRYSLNKGRYVSDLKKLIQPGNCYYGRKQKSLISHTEPDKLVGIFTRGQEPGYRVAGNIVADIKRTIALIDNFDPREKLKEIAAKGRYENLAVLIGLAEAVIFFSQPNDQERAESLIAEFLNDDCFGDLLKYLSGNFKETEKRPYIINSARELIHRIASQAGCFESRDAVEGELAVVLTPTQGGCYVILETGSYGYIKLLTLQRDLGGGRPGTLSKNLVTPGELFAVEHDPIGGKYRDIPVTSVRRLPDAIVAGAQPDPYASGLDELELGRKHGGNPGGSDDSEVSITAIIDTQVANLPQASATRKLLQLAREGYASLIAEKVQPALTNEFMATRNAARNILGIIDDEGLEQSHEPVSDEAIKAGLMSVELLFSQLPADLVTVSAKITAIAQQTANSRVAVDIVRLSTQALLDPITRPYGKQILISLIDKQSEPIRINAKRLLNNEDEEVLEACADILFAVEGIEDWREKLAEAAEQAGGGLTGMVVDIFENSAACQLILHQPLEGRRRSAFIPVSILKDDLNDGKHISDINDIAPRGTCITGEYRKTGQGGIGLGGLCWPDDPRGGYRGSRNADFIKQRIRALANVVHRNPIAREELLRYSREGFLDQVVGCVKMKAMFNSREKIRIACRDLLVEIADTDQYSRLLKIVGLNHLDSHPIETMELLSYIFANSNKLKQKLQAAEAFAEPGEVVGLALCRDRRKIGCLLALSDGSFGYFGVGAVKSLAQRLRAEGFNTSDYLGEGACIVGKSGELGDSRFGQVRFLSSDIRLARDGRCGRSIDQQAEQGKTEADKAEPAKVKVEELPSLDKVLTIREVIEKVDITLSPRFAVFNTGTPNEIGSQVADLVYDAVRFAEENKHGLTVEELESFIFILMADKNNNMYRKVINGLSKTFLTNNDSLVALGKQFFNKMFYYEEYEDDDYTDNVRRSVFVRLTKIALKKSAPARDNAMSMLTNFAEAGYAHYFAQCASGYILSEVDRADVIEIALKLCAGIDNWRQYLRTAIERIQTEDDEIVVMAVGTRNYQGVLDDKKGFYVIEDSQGQIPDLKFIRQDALAGLGEVGLGTILTARPSDLQYWEDERRSFPVVVNPRKPAAYAGTESPGSEKDAVFPRQKTERRKVERSLPLEAANEEGLARIRDVFKKIDIGEQKREKDELDMAEGEGLPVIPVEVGQVWEEYPPADAEEIESPMPSQTTAKIIPDNEHGARVIVTPELTRNIEAQRVAEGEIELVLDFPGIPERRTNVIDSELFGILLHERRGHIQVNGDKRQLLSSDDPQLSLRLENFANRCRGERYYTINTACYFYYLFAVARECDTQRKLEQRIRNFVKVNKAIYSPLGPANTAVLYEVIEIASAIWQARENNETEVNLRVGYRDPKPRNVPLPEEVMRQRVVVASGTSVVLDESEGAIKPLAMGSDGTEYYDPETVCQAIEEGTLGLDELNFDKETQERFKKAMADADESKHPLVMNVGDKVEHVRYPWLTWDYVVGLETIKGRWLEVTTAGKELFTEIFNERVAGERRKQEVKKAALAETGNRARSGERTGDVMVDALRPPNEDGAGSESGANFAEANAAPILLGYDLHRGQSIYQAGILKHAMIPGNAVFSNTVRWRLLDLIAKGKAPLRVKVILAEGEEREIEIRSFANFKYVDALPEQYADGTVDYYSIELTDDGLQVLRELEVARVPARFADQVEKNSRPALHSLLPADGWFSGEGRTEVITTAEELEEAINREIEIIARTMSADFASLFVSPGEATAVAALAGRIAELDFITEAGIYPEMMPDVTKRLRNVRMCQEVQQAIQAIDPLTLPEGEENIAVVTRTTGRGGIKFEFKFTDSIREKIRIAIIGLRNKRTKEKINVLARRNDETEIKNTDDLNKAWAWAAENGNFPQFTEPVRELLIYLGRNGTKIFAAKKKSEDEYQEYLSLAALVVRIGNDVVAWDVKLTDIFEKLLSERAVDIQPQVSPQPAIPAEPGTLFAP